MHDEILTYSQVGPAAIEQGTFGASADWEVTGAPVDAVVAQGTTPAAGAEWAAAPEPETAGGEWGAAPATEQW